MPGLWCQRTPWWDGCCIAWDGREKFYAATEWLSYLIAHEVQVEMLVEPDPRYSEYGPLAYESENDRQRRRRRRPRPAVG